MTKDEQADEHLRAAGLYYQLAASRTAGGTLAGYGLGLAGETGEVVDQIKKHLDHGHDLDLDHLADELGDVLWYIAAICDATGLHMGRVMERNIWKLERRYPDGFSEERSKNRDE